MFAACAHTCTDVFVACNLIVKCPHLTIVHDLPDLVATPCTLCCHTLQCTCTESTALLRGCPLVWHRSPQSVATPSCPPAPLLHTWWDAVIDIKGEQTGGPPWVKRPSKLRGPPARSLRHVDSPKLLFTGQTAAHARKDGSNQVAVPQ